MSGKLEIRPETGVSDGRKRLVAVLDDVIVASVEDEGVWHLVFDTRGNKVHVAKDRVAVQAWLEVAAPLLRQFDIERVGAGRAFESVEQVRVVRESGYRDLLGKAASCIELLTAMTDEDTADARSLAKRCQAADEHGLL